MIGMLIKSITVVEIMCLHNVVNVSAIGLAVSSTEQLVYTEMR